MLIHHKRSRPRSVSDFYLPEVLLEKLVHSGCIIGEGLAITHHGQCRHHPPHPPPPPHPTPHPYHPVNVDADHGDVSGERVTPAPAAGKGGCVSITHNGQGLSLAIRKCKDALPSVCACCEYIIIRYSLGWSVPAVSIQYRLGLCVPAVSRQYRLACLCLL